MRVWSLLAALFFVGVAGCDTGTGLLSPRESRELVSAISRWQASPVRNAYSFEARQSCFCPPELTEWRRIRVVNGVVTDVRTSAGDAVPAAQWDWYLTVDQRFELLLRDHDANAADLTAAFDAEYGYPTEVSLAGKPNIADYGVTWYARNLQPVSVP